MLADSDSAVASPLEPTSGSQPAGRDLDITLEQVLRIFAGVTWITLGWFLGGSSFSAPGAAIATLLCSGAGLVIMVLAVSQFPPRWLGGLDRLLILGTAVLFALWVYTISYQPAQRTLADNALSQNAAELLVRGTNPYGRDLAAAFARYGVAPGTVPARNDGASVYTLDSPALSFLLYVPFVLAGFHEPAVLYANGAMWIFGMLALWLVLPKASRLVVPLLFALPVYFPSLLSANVILPLPFLVAALWNWNHFVDSSRKPIVRYVGPAALGLACAVSSDVWFLALFVLLGIGLEAYRQHHPAARTLLSYLAVLVGSFALANAAFILLGYRSWVSGALGSPLGYLTHSPAGIILSALLVMEALWTVAWYRSFRHFLAVLPVPPYLLSTHPSAIFLIPISFILVIVTATSKWPYESNKSRWLGLIRMPLAVAAPVLFAAGALIAANLPTHSPPLQLAVTGHQSIARPQEAVDSSDLVSAVSVSATNRTRKPLSPRFSLAPAGYADSLWLIHKGPMSLDAGETAQYELWAPNVEAMPAANEGFQVFAFTDDPPRTSSSPHMQGEIARVQLSPDAVDGVVPVGSELVLTARILDANGRATRGAGVAVALQQVTYLAGQPVAPPVSINDSTPGQAMAVALTDSEGIARFDLRAVAAPESEVYYRGWLEDDHTRGYSEPLSVRFGVRDGR